MTDTVLLRFAIAGHVQGVGYRAWLRKEARALGLAGWVRNRLDGTVEAVLSGPSSALDRMAGLCRAGPQLARVEAVRVEAVEGGPEVLPDDVETRPTA